MRISFHISRVDAMIALMYCLSYGTVIKSKKQFRQEVTNYFMQNGQQCIEDHEYEHQAYRQAATELVNKYFK